MLCKHCIDTLFVPTIQSRKLGTLDVISFYRYSTLEPLLLTKHKPEGYRIYRALAHITMKPFIEEFLEADDRNIYIVGIDENVKSGYSHVALLTRSMKLKHCTPLHASLVSKNRISFSGKSLQYRLENMREFIYNGKEDIDVILVDDIVTTGITLQEAQKKLMEHNVNVLFALTLADVEED